MNHIIRVSADINSIPENAANDNDFSVISAAVTAAGFDVVLPVMIAPGIGVVLQSTGCQCRRKSERPMHLQNP